MHLLTLVLTLENPAAVLKTHHGLGKRKIGSNNVSHCSFYRFNLRVCHKIYIRTTILKRLQLADFTIQTTRKGIIYHKNLVREHLAHNLLQHKAQRADICAASIRMIITHKAHVVRIDDLIVKRLQLVVHKGSKNILASNLLT